MCCANALDFVLIPLDLQMARFSVSAHRQVCPNGPCRLVLVYRVRGWTRKLRLCLTNVIPIIVTMSRGRLHDWNLPESLLTCFVLL